MIAKIVTGASFGGCTAYAYGKDQAEVIAYDGIIPDDPKIAAKCFDVQAQLNPKVSKPVGHIAISFKPEDKPRLTNEFMSHVAKEYMAKMGIKDTQYVIVRHHNIPNPHCHLIFNRVDYSGQSMDPSVHESRSHEQDHSLTTDLANIASEQAIGLIASGQGKKSEEEEEDFAPRKKRGPRL